MLGAGMGGAIGSIAGLSEIIHRIALLLPERGNDSQDSFSETAAGFALGSKTYLALGYTVANLPFAQVVGRFYTFDMYERPQRLRTLEDVTASAGGFVVRAVGFLSKLCAHLLRNRFYTLLKGGMGHRSVAHLIPPFKQQLTLSEDSFADALGFSAAFDESLKVAEKVRPA